MSKRDMTLQEKGDLIEEAIKHGIPIIFYYVSKTGNVSCRAVKIERHAFNEKNQLYVHGIDSLSHESRSFSVDSMECLHLCAFQPIISVNIDLQESSYETMMEGVDMSPFGNPILPFPFNRPGD